MKVYSSGIGIDGFVQYHLSHDVNQLHRMDVFGRDGDLSLCRVGVKRNLRVCSGLVDGEYGSAGFGTAASTIASDGICGSAIGADGNAVGAVASVPHIAFRTVSFEQTAWRGTIDFNNLDVHFGCIKHCQGKVLPWRGRSVGIGEGANLSGGDGLFGKFVWDILACLVDDEQTAVAIIGKHDVVDPCAVVASIAIAVLSIAEIEDMESGSYGE